MCTSTHSRWVSRFEFLFFFIIILILQCTYTWTNTCAFVRLHFEQLYPLSHHQSVALSLFNLVISLFLYFPPSRSHDVYAQLNFEFVIWFDWVGECWLFAFVFRRNIQYKIHNQTNSQTRLRRRHQQQQQQNTHQTEWQQRHQRQRYRARLLRNCLACTCQRVSVSIYIYSRSHVVCVYNILFFFLFARAIKWIFVVKSFQAEILPTKNKQTNEIVSIFFFPKCHCL